ncbi:MAG: RSP_7527 family protein [Bradyrhizobium sp.]
MTAELITFYTRRAHALRAEAYRDAVRAVWRSLLRIVRGS